MRAFWIKYILHYKLRVHKALPNYTEPYHLWWVPVFSIPVPFLSDPLWTVTHTLDTSLGAQESGNKDASRSRKDQDLPNIGVVLTKITWTSWFSPFPAVLLSSQDSHTCPCPEMGNFNGGCIRPPGLVPTLLPPCGCSLPVDSGSSSPPLHLPNMS